MNLARQFGRIQINVVASRIDVDCLVDDIQSGRHPTQRLASDPGHSILFDASGGRGVGPLQWPDPIEGKLCGYAGGMGPTNVAFELERVSQHTGNRPFWIDMEGGLRNTEDCLDLSWMISTTGST